ncbi:MAG: hypothetical protein AAFX93_19490 [Verrucomicrobiota bacterium]
MITAIDFYDKDDVLPRCGNCLSWLKYIGVEVHNGRCAAIWRNGDNPSAVAVSADQWYDHVSNEGGGLVELVQATKLDGIRDAKSDPGYFNKTLAILAEWAGVQPRQKRRVVSEGYNPIQALLDDGYIETKRYLYQDDAGNVIYHNARFEHPDKAKEFRQGTPDGKWTVKGIEPLLYRWNDSAKSSSWCVIVEGEKDVDTLVDRGVPATNGRTASKWSQDTLNRFAGKDVCIIRDNDDAGSDKGKIVAARLKGIAKSVRMGAISGLPKGDVTDWFEKESGDMTRLFAWMHKLPELDLSKEEFSETRAIAKEANRFPFSNYISVKVTNHLGKEKTEKKPRHINDMVKDIYKRFMDFPRVIGRGCLFDHDLDTGEVHMLHKADHLIGWIDAKSGKNCSFSNGDNFRTAAQLYDRLAREGISYEAISEVPNWPKRNDIFYAHEPLPAPTPGHRVFEEFVSMFNPASDAYRTILKALIAAPLWYVPRVSRPGWIIDSEDGAGCGKTTIIEMVAHLYSSDPIRSNAQEMRRNFGEVIKRLVSASGRGKRIFLMDNVTGQFSCDELADMMTSQSISGKAPYGRGEETRPNDLVYTITANSATVDNDLAERCYFIYVKRPEWSKNWRRDVLKFIEANRMQILADIVDQLENGEKRAPETRFPEFCSEILGPLCESEEEFRAALVAMEEAKAASNVEEEQAKTIEDEFQSRLIEANFRPGSEHIFIRSEVLRAWLDDIFPGEKKGAQYIRNLAKNDLTQRFDSKPHIYPHHGPKRKRGIMWVPESAQGETVRIIGMNGRKTIEVI